jgi:hypothetical protein
MTGSMVNVVQPPAHAGSWLADFSTLKMEAIRSSETSVRTRSTRRHIPEDGIFHSHRRENLSSYKIFKLIFSLIKKLLSLIFSLMIQYPLDIM